MVWIHRAAYLFLTVRDVFGIDRPIGRPLTLSRKGKHAGMPVPDSALCVGACTSI